LKDLFRFRSMLSEEEHLVADAAAACVRTRFQDRIEDVFAEGHFPQDWIEVLAEAQYLGITASEAYGGMEASPLIYGLIMKALEAGDSGLRSFASVQNSLVNYPIERFGTEEQRREYLPDLVSGRRIGCFGLTEADHGSDPGSMATKAFETEGGYILNGSKMWITNGNLAHLSVIWAKLRGEIRGFIVPTDLPGFSRRPVPRKWSLRASDTAQLFLQDVELPKEALLPGSGGLKSALACLNKARFGIAWGVLGIVESMLDLALKYSSERRQFGRPLSSFQLQQQKLAELFSRYEQALFISLQTARLSSEDRDHYARISLIKRNNTALARESVHIAREILGAAGISSEYPVMRHMMNIESVYTYEGTHDIHTLILGRYLTGEDAFS